MNANFASLWGKSMQFEGEYYRMQMCLTGLPTLVASAAFGNNADHLTALVPLLRIQGKGKWALKKGCKLLQSDTPTRSRLAMFDIRLRRRIDPHNCRWRKK